MLKQTFVTPLTSVLPVAQAQQDTPGDLRIEGGKVYKYVTFSGTNAVAAGDVVCYTDTTELIVDHANAAVGAGVAMAAVASGSQQNGWILIEGKVTLSSGVGGTTPANGNQVTTTAATAGTVTKAAAVTDQVVGTIIDVTNHVILAQFPY